MALCIFLYQLCDDPLINQTWAGLWTANLEQSLLDFTPVKEGQKGMVILRWCPLTCFFAVCSDK